MTFYPSRYAENLRNEGRDFDECTEGDKVLIGCWMIADALTELRRAIGPTDVVDIHKANVVESMMKSADIIREGMIALSSPS
jgi:hypothetical protein